MFAGIDVTSERHMLARLDGAGTPIGKPSPIIRIAAKFGCAAQPYSVRCRVA
jgi:hypothetical protein